MKLIRAIVLLAAFAISTALHAQGLYGEVTAPPGGEVSEIGLDRGARISWMSSYQDLQLYRDPACVTPHQKADFLEEFFELWHDGEAVLLGKSDAPKTDKATSISGYARIEELLRSREYAYSCLKTSSGVERKALIVHQWHGGHRKT